VKKNNILIFGKNSFVGSNLYRHLKKNYLVKIKDFNSNNLKKISLYDCIINCSINKNYVYGNYKVKNDFDLKIVKKIKHHNTKYIFLQTRKIYIPKSDIKENSSKKCKENYEKNKYVTEKKISKILKNKLVVLRVSNIIGDNYSKSRKIHKTYLDYLIQNVSKNKIIDNQKKFKDFIDINFFSKIVHNIIKKKIYGVFNISIGEKIYLNDINTWLLSSLRKKNELSIVNNVRFPNDESFFLNNSKIKKKIKFKYNKNDLKKECIKLSKKIFKNI
jgi:nucleoside-diphosphate-sugar epimerase